LRVCNWHVSANPDKSGLNETNFVLEYTKPQGSDAWAGFFYQLEAPINVTDESVFKLNVWSPRADIEAIMKLERQSGGPATGDLKADVTAAEEWVELVWDLSAQNQETNWDKVVVIMDLATCIRYRQRRYGIWMISVLKTYYTGIG
jgi:hypothetical protein